ncbi:MAG: hypothetical protein HYR96_06860 [Deltaproteobacteria bacterium]|nr:hypothetical protein [Deltaproteobacteria bacterium]MBI3294183.1 hypothetical protein [Deltaproteobacteria bacterium]
MLEILTSGDQMIAIFIGATHSPEKTSFLTPLSEPIQLGIGVFKKGGCVEPHRHRGKAAVVEEFQEFIMVKRGKVIASVYDTSDTLLKEFEMGPGDSLLLLRGGHAFHFLEDTEFLELKQGPYLGRENMKTLINPRPVVEKPAVHQAVLGVESTTRN